MLVIQHIPSRLVFALNESTGSFEPAGREADLLVADLLVAQEDESPTFGVFWAATKLEKRFPSRWKVLQAEPDIEVEVPPDAVY